MNKYNLLNKKQYQLNDDITINIPLVGDLWGDGRDISKEQGYLSIATMFLQTPTDVMLWLKECGIYWTDVSDYEVFVLTMLSFLSEVQNEQTKEVSINKWNLLFPNLDCENIKLGHLSNSSTDDMKSVVFIDDNDKVIFNPKIYEQISDLLCCILHAEKNHEYQKVPEKDTRDYILQRAKTKYERELARNKKKNKSSSVLDGVILFLVNNCNFKYDFETVKSLTIYDLYACYKQINKNSEVNDLMSGYYFGTVDLKKIDESKLQRIII